MTGQPRISQGIQLSLLRHQRLLLSHAAPSNTGAADPRLKQQLVVRLPKMEGEKLKGISSRSSTQQPRASTPLQGDNSRTAEEEGMEVDTPVMQATSKC